MIDGNWSLIRVSKFNEWSKVNTAILGKYFLDVWRLRGSEFKINTWLLIETNSIYDLYYIFEYNFAGFERSRPLPSVFYCSAGLQTWTPAVVPFFTKDL